MALDDILEVIAETTIEGGVDVVADLLVTTNHPEKEKKEKKHNKGFGDKLLLAGGIITGLLVVATFAAFIWVFLF